MTPRRSCFVSGVASHEDEQVAHVMNAHFVSVKVDREERPDVDAVYMDATTALTAAVSVHPFLSGLPRTAFVAHRGGAGIKPENTLLAFVNALTDLVAS